MHDFSHFMSNNKQTPLNSVRSAIKEKIDPFESLEVNDLGQHALLLTKEHIAQEQDKSDEEPSEYPLSQREEKKESSIDSIERERYPNPARGDKILNQTDDFIVYQRGGKNFFISKTLKAGGGRIEGILVKKT